MARGIEHRTSEGVENAYILNDHAKYAIFSGNEIMYAYDDDNIDNGLSNLKDLLLTLEQGGSSTVYTLKIYNDDVKNVHSKTPCRCSTTFMLNNTAGTKMENGVIVMDRGGQANNNNSSGNAALVQRLDKLEQVNREYQEKLHKAELANITQRFEHQIAGLNKPDTEKMWYDRIGEMIAEKPERLDKLIEKVGDALGYLFSGKKQNFIQERPAAAGNPVQGTHVNTDNMSNATDTTNEVKTTKEGAYLHDFLTDEERSKKKAERFEIMHKRLSDINQEDRDDDGANELDREQLICIELLERRLGPVTLTQLLLNLAGLDDEQLNDVVNHMR